MPMKQSTPVPWSRRLTALLLVLMMAVSIVPFTALAVETGPDPPMSAENQTNVADMQRLYNHLNNTGPLWH